MQNITHIKTRYLPVIIALAGASYAFRTALDDPGVMQTERPLKDGKACYYKDFGRGKNRWGDYSATVVDPTDDKKLWTLQEYAEMPAGSGTGPTDDRWGTWWGMLDPTPVIKITDPSVFEGDLGTTPLKFDVSLVDSQPTPQPLPTSQTVTVSWAIRTDLGTAATPADYALASGTLTFAPGDTLKTIEVAVQGDITLGQR